MGSIERCTVQLVNYYILKKKIIKFYLSLNSRKSQLINFPKYFYVLAHVRVKENRIASLNMRVNVRIDMFAVRLADLWRSYSHI